MIGQRDEVQVIDNPELRRPYIVRPAYREDPEPPSGLLDVLMAIALGCVGLAVIGSVAFVICRLLLPTVN